jgi:hypothetical protein
MNDAVLTFLMHPFRSLQIVDALSLHRLPHGQWQMGSIVTLAAHTLPGVEAAGQVPTDVLAEVADRADEDFGAVAGTGRAVLGAGDAGIAGLASHWT